MLKLDVSKEAQEEYSQASPWPHCVIDGMWPDDLLNDMAQEWPNHDHPSWHKVSGFRQDNLVNKYRNYTPSTFPPVTERMFSYLRSPEASDQVGKVVGHRNLVADPSTKFYLMEGMHLNGPGSALDLHRDGLWNPGIQQYRVVNLIIYLNPEWKEKDGGELILWDAATKKQAVSISPRFNRMVISAANDDAVHHVQPIHNRDRKSLAVWYYTSYPPTPKNIKDRDIRYFDWE